MKTFIAILRGINVGGKNIIKMDTLRDLFLELKFENIVTYIQSGNIIFQTLITETNELEIMISNKILEKLNIKVPTIVLNSNELNFIYNNNPFITRNEDVSKLHVTFLSKIPENINIEKINSSKFLPDEFIINNKAVFLFCQSYGATKLNNNFFEKNLNLQATTRNWKTVCELLKISN